MHRDLQCDDRPHKDVGHLDVLLRLEGRSALRVTDVPTDLRGLLRFCVKGHIRQPAEGWVLPRPYGFGAAYPETGRGPP